MSQETGVTADLAKQLTETGSAAESISDEEKTRYSG